MLVANRLENIVNQLLFIIRLSARNNRLET